MDLSTLSALGAQNVWATNPISALTATALASTDPVATGLEAGSDSLSLSAQGLWTSRSQDSSPFKTDFNTLGKLIASGDLEGAKKAFAEMLAKMKHHKKEATDPLAADFEALGKALDSGDLAAAKKAWETLQADLETLKSSQLAPDTRTRASARSPQADLEALLLASHMQSTTTPVAAAASGADGLATA